MLFATNDGGVTWKPDRVLAGLQDTQTGSKVASAMADSTWITGRVPKDGMPQLSKLGPGRQRYGHDARLLRISGFRE